MSDKNKHQIVVFLIGENGSGKSWIANRMITQFGWDAKFSITSLLRDMITDPGVFGLSERYFDSELKDKPVDFRIQVQEGHLRRVVSWLAERIPPPLRASMKNDIRKIGISSFARPVLKTPREFLQYIGFSVVNKISQFTLGSLNLLPIMAYNAILGIPGKFIYDDLRMKSQIELAQDKLQFVYPVLVTGFNNKIKNNQLKSQYADVENEWTGIKPFFTIKNSKSMDEVDKMIKSAINAIDNDVRDRIKHGKYSPLPSTADEITSNFIQSKGPLGQNINTLQQTTMKVGKAMFAKAKFDQSGQLTETLTPNDKIQLNYTQARR